MPTRYVGRFAPSPTGSLHLGSLLAAVGSYVDAKAHGGQWLVRIEDIDTPRVIPGSADEILRTLEGFGLHWDGAVEYQSRRTDRYAHVLSELRRLGLVFECSCSRRELAGGSEEGGYPGTCRRGPRRAGPTASRFRVDESKIVHFSDRIQGECCYSLASLGDAIVRRRDGLFAYQLAVVVDDADQNVSDIVRGADLLLSTAWQIELRNALKFPPIQHAHLPLVLESDGSKLAKAKRSVPVDSANAGPSILTVLRLLRQNPPLEPRMSAADALAWAIAHWNPESLRGARQALLEL